MPKNKKRISQKALSFLVASAVGCSQAQVLIPFNTIAAETAPKSGGSSEIHYGDVNYDGVVDGRDAAIIEDHVLNGGKFDFSETIDKTVADVDKDGKVTIRDAELVLQCYVRLAVGLENNLPYTGDIEWKYYPDPANYEVINEGMTWLEAEDYCEANGGHLAVITSSYEQAVVESLIKGQESPKKNYWIGGRLIEEGKFEWITGEPMEYTNWSDGEPNNQGGGNVEDSLHLFPSGKWNDAPNIGVPTEANGVETFGFVMEKDEKPVTYNLWTDPDSLPTSGKYKLGCDVTVGRITVEDYLDLDLNGHTVSAKQIVCSGDVTIRDTSKDKTGTMSTPDSLSLLNVYGKLTLLGGTFIGNKKGTDVATVGVNDGGCFTLDGATVLADYSNPLSLRTSSGTVDIKSGTLLAGDIAKSDSDYTHAAIYMASGYSGTLNISGGNVDSEYASAVYSQSSGGKVNITGGKIISKPKYGIYCPKGTDIEIGGDCEISGSKAGIYLPKGEKISITGENIAPKFSVYAEETGYIADVSAKGLDTKNITFVNGDLSVSASGEMFFRKEDDTVKYKVIDKALTWKEAEAYCESIGGHLVTITSSEEQSEIAALASNLSTCFLGGIRNAEGVFEWVTGEDMTYTYWNSGEPNNGLGGGNENVMEMYSSGVWNDCGEYLTKYFICEWDNLPVVKPIYTTTSTTSTTTTTTVTTTAIPENAIKWYIDTVEAYPGETVNLEVRVENKKDYSVDIQKADLRIQKTDGLVLNYISSGNTYTYYPDTRRFIPEKSSFAEIASKDGQEVCYIRFKIPEDCKAGEYPVKFEGTPKITDVNGVDISKNFVFQDGAVIVVNPPANTDTTASTTTTTTTTTTTVTSTSTTTTTTTTREPFAPVTTEYDPQVEKQVEEKKNEKLKITGELTATPMTKEEIVKAGIDVDDPDNYHYFNYSIELTFHDEPIVFTKYEAVPITPSSPSTPSEPVQTPTPKIVFPHTDPVPPGEPVHIPELDITVTYYEYEEQEMYIIVYGRSKWLKEFYDVQLIVFNTDTETLEDCSATLNVPEGLTLCNSKQTQNVGDLLPLDVKNIHWYLRGDVAGDYSLSALFKGVNDGDEFSYVFNSEDNIHVYAGDALKMTIEASSYSCYEYDYPIKITLTNVSDKPIYDLEHKIKNVEHGYYTYTHKSTNGSKTYDSKHPLSGGMTKTVSVDELLPGESAVIELSIHDMWKSPLQKQLENSKLFIDALSLGLGSNPLAACIASFASKCIDGITVIHVLDSFCVTTLKDSTTTIPYEIIINDNLDDIAEGREFDLTDAVVSSVMDQAPSGLKRFYTGGKYYIDAFKFVNDLKDNAEKDWAKVENGDMTVEQFQKKYNKEYLDHIFGNLSTYSDIAGVDISGVLQVASDVYKIVSVPVDSSTCTAYVTDADGNIIDKGEVSRNPKPGMMKKVWAADEPEFEFEILTGDFEYSNGVYTFTEDSLIRMKANKPNKKYIVHFVADDGTEVEFPFVTVPEHECKGGKFYVTGAPESGNDGIAMQFCEVCDKPVKSRRIPASFNSMLSDGQMFQNVYQAAEFARDNYEEVELSIFGDVTLDKDLVIPENVKLIITPFANITYKNSAHIVVDGEYIDFTADKDIDIYENIVLEYWDGRTEIMPVKYGEEVSELPALSESCGFTGWYTDEEFTEPFVPFTAGDKAHSKVYYADVHHSFTSSGKCSKCGELKNGMDAFKKVGISVSSEINLKFIVTLTEKALADKNLRVVFELSDGITEIQSVDDAIDNGDGTYTFNCSVPINNIDENIRAQVCYSKGVKGSYLDYSVKKYADFIINNASSFDKVTVDSIKALVNFSGYVQIFAGKETEEAVNADLGMSLDDVDVKISDEFNAVKKAHSSAVTISTASLSMDKLSNINIKFNLADGVDVNDYIFTVDGKTVVPKKSGKSYIISMKGISPVNFDKMYLFKAQSKNDANDYVSVEYSCLTYAKKVLEISSDNNLKNAMKALYFYNQEIKKYTNEKNDD